MHDTTDPDPGRLPTPNALVVLPDGTHALDDGRGHPFLIRRIGGPVRRVAPGTRLGPSIAVGWLTRREAEATLAEWPAAMVEGGR